MLRTLTPISSTHAWFEVVTDEPWSEVVIGSEDIVRIGSEVMLVEAIIPTSEHHAAFYVNRGIFQSPIFSHQQGVPVDPLGPLVLEEESDVPYTVGPIDAEWREQQTVYAPDYTWKTSVDPGNPPF